MGAWSWLWNLLDLKTKACIRYMLDIRDISSYVSRVVDRTGPTAFDMLKSESARRDECDL